MKRLLKSVIHKKRGSALVMAMIFMLIFSALAVSMAAVSGNNVQVAYNLQKIDSARACAESGMEVQRFWLTPVAMPSTISPDDYLNTIISVVQTQLAADGISNITLNNDGSISSVAIDSADGRNFTGQITVDSNDLYLLKVYSTGNDDEATHTIITGFDIGAYEHPIFNYGLATKGPLSYTGNPTMVAINEPWEADMYVESSGSLTAMTVGGNCNFAGEIEIGNPAATADFAADVLIAGDQGQTAIDNHVHIGSEPVDFPEPMTDYFRPYATGSVIDATTDFTKGMTLVNCKIPAGTNPTFLQSIIIQGILFIESPNIVTFERNVALEGIIVADGDLENPGTDRIDFLGNFASGPYPAGMEFDAIRGEEGSSIVAPGFEASFQGNFSTLEGVVALSGVSFTGNVNAVIKGTIINYSDDPMVIGGNAFMSFDRINSTKIPAGFDTLRVLTYNPSYYEEAAF